VRVRPGVFDDIAAHARRESPRECCGILVGVDDEIVEAVPAANLAADPLRRYEVSPADYFRQIKRCRDSGGDGQPPSRIVGVYHSHPRSAPAPSPTDLEQAFEEYVYLIAGPVDGSASFEICGYRLRDGVFTDVPLR
jgi:proteasome lid subunit RPN8/RPN11